VRGERWITAAAAAAVVTCSHGKSQHLLATNAPVSRRVALFHKDGMRCKKQDNAVHLKDEVV
jgi:hypothetical protein